MRSAGLFGASVALALLGLFVTDGRVQAGVFADGDVLPVALVASIESALGSDTVVLTGWIRVEAAAPRLEEGRSVIDLTVTQADLIGGSRLGAVTVSERPDAEGLYVSRGEVRAAQAGSQFPATSSIDLFVNAEAPNSSLGPLSLHNEAPLHLTPTAGGPTVLIDGWPAFGVTYAHGSALAGGDCVPLLNSDNTVPLANFCVRQLTMEIAPLLPGFSVARDGPRRLHPADILSLRPREAGPGAGQMPFVWFACVQLGLTADGCDDGEDGDQDDIDALSFGHDLSGSGPEAFLSVGPGAIGRPGSGVEGQTACPGLAPEPESDAFAAHFDGSNSLLLDGNGPVGRCTPAFPLGLVEGFAVRDDLDAFEASDVSSVDAQGDGVPDQAVFFSLDAASPTLAALEFSAADLLWTSAGGEPERYASAADLGLTGGDDVDALCLSESGNGILDGEDRLYFSLTAGSPSLSSIGAGAGDLLAPSPLRVVAPASTLGLASGDDLDALSCGAIAESVTGDVTCDLIVNSIDALLIMQYNSDLIGTLPCVGGADVDGNGGVDSVDAALVLQLHAGLLTRLPPHEAGGW